MAVKWAALEVLEDHSYLFESDMYMQEYYCLDTTLCIIDYRWSYAVIVWEIASYGGRPFSDQKIGASLEKFIRLLKAGHRLPQPSGLSNSM